MNMTSPSTTARSQPMWRGAPCSAFALVGLLAPWSFAEAGEPPGSEPGVQAPVLPAETPGREWSFSASVCGYFVPDDDDYAQPTFAADRGWLHLEARYNYEALDTGSFWVGYNLAGEGTITWEFTPMLGGVVGENMGFAPGFKGSVGWWKLELYSEGEFVFQADGDASDFFYSWSELTVSPWDWFRAGLVTQRTRAYDAERDIQRGVLVGFSHRGVDLTTCVFNPDESSPLVTVSVGVNF